MKVRDRELDKYFQVGPKRRVYSSLAQSVEHAAVNRSVVGSSPTGGAFLFSDFKQRAQWFSKMKAIVFFVILLYKSEAIGIY